MGWLPSLRELFGKAAAPDSAPDSKTISHARDAATIQAPPLQGMTEEQWTAEKEKRSAEKEKWAADKEKWAAKRAEKIERMMSEGLSKKFASESDPSSTNKGARLLELRQDTDESPLPSQPMTDEEWAEQRDKRVEQMLEDLKSKAHDSPVRTNDRGLSR